MTSPSPSAAVKDALHEFDDTMTAAFSSLGVEDAAEMEASAPKNLFRFGGGPTNENDPLGSPIAMPSYTSTPYLQDAPQHPLPQDETDPLATSTPAPATSSWIGKQISSVVRMTANITSKPSASKPLSFLQKASARTRSALPNVQNVSPLSHPLTTQSDDAGSNSVPPASTNAGNFVSPCDSVGANTGANSNALVLPPASAAPSDAAATGTFGGPSLTDTGNFGEANVGATVPPSAPVGASDATLTANNGTMPDVDPAASPVAMVSPPGSLPTSLNHQTVTYQHTHQGYAPAVQDPGWIHQGTQQPAVFTAPPQPSAQVQTQQTAVFTAPPEPTVQVQGQQPAVFTAPTQPTVQVQGQQPAVFTAPTQPSVQVQGQQPAVFAAPTQPSVPNQGQHPSVLPASTPSGVPPQGQQPPVPPTPSQFSVPSQSYTQPGAHNYGWMPGPQPSSQPPSMPQMSVPGQGGIPGIPQGTPHATTHQSSIPSQGGLPGFSQGAQQPAITPQASIPQQGWTPGVQQSTTHPYSHGNQFTGHTPGPSAAQPWSGIRAKPRMISDVTKVRGYPTAKHFRWDGSTSSFRVYKQRFEASCRQQGAGYIVHTLFLQIYSSNPSYASSIDCFNTWNVSTAQIRQDSDWLHGCITNTLLDPDIPELVQNTDGIIAWFKLCKTYGNEGDSYKNTIFFQTMDTQLREHFDKNRWGLAEYDKRFLCTAARLEKHDPYTYTRKKILEIYMGYALTHMGSGLLAPFNQLRDNLSKSYTEVINEIADHTDSSIANSQSRHLNTKFINNMQQQADALLNPEYILARDRHTNMGEPTRQELQAAATEFRAATDNFLRPIGNIKKAEIEAMKQACAYFTRTSKSRANDMTFPPRLWKALEPQIQKHINRLQQELRDEDKA